MSPNTIIPSRIASSTPKEDQCALAPAEVISATRNEVHPWVANVLPNVKRKSRIS